MKYEICKCVKLPVSIDLQIQIQSRSIQNLSSTRSTSLCSTPNPSQFQEELQVFLYKFDTSLVIKLKSQWRFINKPWSFSDHVM